MMSSSCRCTPLQRAAVGGGDGPAPHCSSIAAAVTARARATSRSCTARGKSRQYREAQWHSSAATRVRTSEAERRRHRRSRWAPVGCTMSPSSSSRSVAAPPLEAAAAAETAAVSSVAELGGRLMLIRLHAARSSSSLALGFWYSCSSLSNRPRSPRGQKRGAVLNTTCASTDCGLQAPPPLRPRRRWRGLAAPRSSPLAALASVPAL